MNRRVARSFIAVLLLVMLLNSGTAFACGPFTLEAIFVFSAHPGYPLEKFADGTIGVVQPTYARSYLYVAYRHLAGLNFSQSEQKALSALWKDRLDYGWDLGQDEWIKAWLAARQKVSGLAQPPEIDVYRSREKPNEYETYLNCQKDAFDTAIATLNERITKYGSQDPAVRSWVEAQDQVFANCSEGQHLPAAAPSTADPLARADRTYQTAAAHFYSGSFDDALKGFQAVAADSTSPWRRAAPYLAARTLIRKASLGPAETKQESLSQAEALLKKILSDSELANSHAAAVRLSDLVRLRLHPSERLHELANTLLAKKQNDHLKQDLWDYTVLLDQYLETDEAKPRDVVKGDELSDWISTFQSAEKESLDHSLARWQTTSAAAWLVAALSKLDGHHPKAPELITEAMKVNAGSAAFASARYHVVRLLSESGKTAEARTLIDQLLRENREQLDESSLNLLTSRRMMLANNLSEFLSYAPRVPAALSWNDDGREIPTEDSEISEEHKVLKGKPLFDAEAATALNRQMPLSLLKGAAETNELPVPLRRDLAQAVWLRAVLLGDSKTADELVPTLRNLVPELSSLLNDFVARSQPEAKKFSGIYAWLKFPGLEPIVDQGIGRETPLNKQDTYRDNWWCGAAFSVDSNTKSGEKEEGQSLTVKPVGAPLFLSEAQKAAASREWDALRSLGPAPSYLCQQVVQWVNRNPADPRAPEALHLAVNSTRYGCTDKETGRWSKAAFDLLHRKYPNTSWARKTPYWFKD